LLSPEIPAKFQENIYGAKYLVWIEKIKKIENTLDYSQLLTKVVGAVYKPDKSPINKSTPVVEAPPLTIDLTEEDP
jgi:hypothetical protein